MMIGERKYSVFISSTYEDLKDERQALLSVALENHFIPVGMEQFHAHPAGQWDVITKMIDECDFYLLMIGGRYGTVDESVDMSYTEKEYEYAKRKGLPVLILIKNQATITIDKTDADDGRLKRSELMNRLTDFRDRVMNDNNTCDTFDDVKDLRYKAVTALRNAIDDASLVDSNIGWVRYKDVAEIINERVDEANRVNNDEIINQRNMLKTMQTMHSSFGDKLSDLQENAPTWEEIPKITAGEIEGLFQINGEKLIIDESHKSEENADKSNSSTNSVILDNFEAQSLLIYASRVGGRINVCQSITRANEFIEIGAFTLPSNDDARESAKWVEAIKLLEQARMIESNDGSHTCFILSNQGWDVSDTYKAEWINR